MSSNSVRVTNLPVTQPVSGTVTATGPLTDTQLRATAVPVSGTVTASGPLTDTQLRATAVPVSLASAPTTAVTAAALPLPSGASTAAKQPALGTAGTASADVITVQGVASAVPLSTGLRGVYVAQTPTVTNGAYAAEDVVGGLLTFANAARTNAGSGLISTITIFCKSPLTLATVPSLELAIFNQTFTNIADNGVWAPSDADGANCIGTIPMSAWSVSSNNCIATRFNLGFKYTLTGTSLFAQLITHTAVTLTSTSDIIVSLDCIYLD